VSRECKHNYLQPPKQSSNPVSITNPHSGLLEFNCEQAATLHPFPNLTRPTFYQIPMQQTLFATPTATVLPRHLMEPMPLPCTRFPNHTHGTMYILPYSNRCISNSTDGRAGRYAPFSRLFGDLGQRTTVNHLFLLSQEVTVANKHKATKLQSSRQSSEFAAG
jgi:hypothetical protein